MKLHELKCKTLAAVMFFTRLPLWKWVSVDKEYFKRIVHLWSFTGWFTALVMILVFGISIRFFPLHIAVILAIAARVILTGGLHEDGFADFCDAFGCFADKQRTLDIMKDSHIGTYGVIGLALYFLLLTFTLCSLPMLFIPSAFCADPFCKFVSSNIINVLPYARNEQTAKNKLVYDKMNAKEWIVSLVFGCMPLALLPSASLLWAVLTPIIVAAVLFHFMNKRINGYTGDCCGATFIICELSFYMTLLAIVYA